MSNLDDVLVEHIKVCHLLSCKYPHEGRSCEECEHFKCIDRCPRCVQDALLDWQRNELLGKNERLGVMEFINNSKYEFTNIDNETVRIYEWGDGRKVEIVHPVCLAISSKGHRVFDAQGTSHYIPSGWIHLRWAVSPGSPNFVK